MIFIFGIGGFVGGFILGVMVISFFLKQTSNKELMENKSYRWTYGIFVWIVAMIGCWAAIKAYHEYFL